MHDLPEIVDTETVTRYELTMKTSPVPQFPVAGVVVITLFVYMGLNLKNLELIQEIY